MKGKALKRRKEALKGQPRTLKGVALVMLLTAIALIALVAFMIGRSVIPALSGAKTNVILNTMKSDAMQAIATEKTFAARTGEYGSVSLDGGTNGQCAPINSTYPDIKICASKGNTVDITAKDSDGDGINDCFVVKVSNPNVNEVATYDSCAGDASVHFESSSS